MRMTSRWVAGIVLLLAIVALAAWFGLATRSTDAMPGTLAGIDGAPPEIVNQVERGQYLARAADCVACHTAEGGKAFAGGRTFTLPFGTLYSTNITADSTTGIGTWSDDEFVRAVREGVGREGHLYPAMPYTSYTGMSRADVLAIKAYLFSLPPVAQPRRANGIGFPFNQRWGLHLWDVVFFRRQSYVPVAAQDTQWNRGAYLTTALGHCGECHTPRNLGFAMSSARFLAGAEIEGWVAPNLTQDGKSGLGDWSVAQLEQYLSRGHAPGRSSASGPMAEVISNSLQYLSGSDIASMATYLRAVPAQSEGSEGAVSLQAPREVRVANGLPIAPPPGTDSGARLFAGDCAGCHLWNGHGRQSDYADLLGTRSVNDPTARSVIQVILQGTHLTVGSRQETMPPFANRYSDTEVAELANYLIGLFGTKQGRATAEQVARQRGM
jgi:mono/diheme cytochrome c family protein